MFLPFNFFSQTVFKKLKSEYLWVIKGYLSKCSIITFSSLIDRTCSLTQLSPDLYIWPTRREFLITTKTAWSFTLIYIWKLGSTCQPNLEFLFFSDINVKATLAVYETCYKLWIQLKILYWTARSCERRIITISASRCVSERKKLKTTNTFG